METEEAGTIEYILSGIIHNPKTWEVLLPDFLNQLLEYSEAQRKRIIDDIINVALEELSQENYETFVERVIMSIGKLPDDVRYAVLTSSIISPEGVKGDKSEKVSITLGHIIKKVTAQDNEDMQGVIRAVLEAMLTMREEDGIAVMRAVVANSRRFSRANYLRYAVSWLNVAGDMDKASLKKFLRMRGEVLAEVEPIKQLISNDTLIKVAMMRITEERRRRILEATESLNKESR